MIFLVLGIEPRAMYVLGTYSTTKLDVPEPWTELLNGGGGQKKIGREERKLGCLVMLHCIHGNVQDRGTMTLGQKETRG